MNRHAHIHRNTHTHTHTHIYAGVYICIYISLSLSPIIFILSLIFRKCEQNFMNSIPNLVKNLRNRLLDRGG